MSFEKDKSFFSPETYLVELCSDKGKHYHSFIATSIEDAEAKAKQWMTHNPEFKSAQIWRTVEVIFKKSEG